MKKLGKTLIQVQYGASIVAALMLLLMIGYEVFARYVLKSSLMGIEEFDVISYYMALHAGRRQCSYEKSHIECGILTLYIKKERSKLIFDAIKRTLCIIILAWICYWGFYFFSYSLKTWKLADITYAPLFFANIALTVGFVLMFIYAARDVYMAYRALIGQMKNKDEAREGGENL